MRSLFDSAWRAAAYCLHPRVIGMSVLPLLLMVGVALALGYFFWEGAVEAVRVGAQEWQLTASLFLWLDSVGLGGFRAALAPLVVVFVATPVIVVGALLVVAGLMTPFMVSLVAERRFPQLERRHGGSFWLGLVRSMGVALVALVGIALSVPLWFIPPLVLILPPLIWGWLTYKVMSYDVLAEHATAAERQVLVRRHGATFLAMGVLTGYLGAAPSVVWASGVFFLALAPVLVPVAIWIYTLVFAFSALWYAHFALSALQRLRSETAMTVEEVPREASRLSAPVPRIETQATAGSASPAPQANEPRRLSDLRDFGGPRATGSSPSGPDDPAPRSTP